MKRWLKRLFCKHELCRCTPCYIGSVPTYVLVCVECGKTLKDVPVINPEGRRGRK